MNPQLPPQPPVEPLDEEERRLARALRGLPASMPPPELDARILGASRRAIAIAPKPRLLSQGRIVGLSSAAVALIAVGMLLKLHTLGRDQSIQPPAQEPATATPAFIEPAGPAPTANAPAPLEMQSMHATSPTESTKTAEQAPAAIGNATGTVQKAPMSERDALRGGIAPAATPVPPPPEAPVVTDSRTYISMPAPPPPPAPASAPAPAMAKTASTPIPPVSSAPPAQEAERKNAAAERKNGAAERQDAQLDRVEVVGSRIRRESGAGAVSDQAQSNSAVLPPLDDDATLPPSRWIERIRARVNAADGQGARESLRRFVARYPDAEIPADLAPLRK